MTTAGQRLVALSGLGNATATQHFMALSSGGGGAVASAQGAQFLFALGAVRVRVANPLRSTLVPATCGEVGATGGTLSQGLPYYVGGHDLIGSARGALCTSWEGSGAVVLEEGEAAAFSLSGPEPAIICLDTEPSAMDLADTSGAFVLY